MKEEWMFMRGGSEQDVMGCLASYTYLLFVFKDTVLYPRSIWPPYFSRNSLF